MSPKSSLTGPFNAADQANEVVCPLQNNDGSVCRKRCFGEKRFRSMQEHIRRAHPNHYISKLPATEESFLLMVNTPPSQRPPSQQNNLQQHSTQQHGASAPFSDFDPPYTNHSGMPGFMHEPGGFYGQNGPSNMFPHHDARRPSFVPTANAAAALAQLHNSRPESDWEVDREPPFHDPTTENFPNYFANSDSNIFSDAAHAAMADSKDPSLLSSSFPPGSRSVSQQPFGRPRPNRPRKSSVAENARKGKHERHRSKDHKRMSGERKALSAEPGTQAAGTRWEDLLDAAAASATEESRELTPIPQTPRGSVPPYQPQNHNNQFQSYNTSPLQNTVLPHSPEHAPSFEPPVLEAFPSVEPGAENQSSFQQPYQPQHQHNSSADSSISNPFDYARPGHQQQSSSGSNFHINASGLSSSPNDIASSATSAYSRTHGHSHSWTAPQYDAQARGVSQQAPPAPVQHYCAACHRITPLNSSYACTECICGICRDCVDVLVSMGADRGARCPHCSVVGSRFKPFMLDLR